jgi:putative ABC transport system permease protein
VLRVFGWLNLRSLRAQGLRALLAVLAVAAGVSLGLAVLVQYRSLLHSVKSAGSELAGPAPIRVTGPAEGTVPDDVLLRVAAVPDVGAVVPMVQAVSVVQGSGGDRPVLVVGADCSVERLVGPVGCAAPSVGAPLPAALAVAPSLIRKAGLRGAVRTTEGPVPLVNATASPILDRVASGRLVVMPVAVARHQFDRRGYDVIYVLPRAGARLADVRREVVAAAGSGAAVLRADERPLLVSQATGFLPQLALIALLAELVGGMLVFSVVSLSLAERRREIAIASALGRRRGSTALGAISEAGTIGVAGGLLGTVGAYAVAHLLVGAARPVAESYGVSVKVLYEPTIVLAGVATGWVIAVLAAVVPVWQASRLSLAEELADRGTVDAVRSTRRGPFIVFSLLMVAVGMSGALASGWRGSIYAWQPLVGDVGSLLAIAGAAGLVVTVGPAVLRSVRGLTDRRTGVVHLAGASAGSSSRRAASALLAIAMAVNVGAFLASLVPAIEAGSSAYADEYVGDRVVLSPVDLDHSTLGLRLPSSLAAAVAAVPGVAAVQSRVVLSTGYRTSDRVQVVSDEGAPFRYPVQLGLVTTAAFDRGETVVGTALARAHGLRPGSRLTFQTPRGPIALKVAAIWTDPAANGYEATVSPAVMALLYGPQTPRELAVVAAPGVSVNDLAARLRHAALGPDVRVWTPRQYGDQTTYAVRQQLRPFRVLEQSLVVVVLVSTLATLLLQGVQRRREVAVLGALGLGPRDLVMSTLGEAALLGLAGCVLGAIGSLVLTIGARSTLSYLFGVAPPFRYAVVPTLSICALSIATAVVGGIWPARRLSKVPVASALRYE